MSDTENVILAAKNLAQRLHQGQVDKAGADYFTVHLSTVASLGKNWQEKVVGYLHDASEDTPHSVDEVLDLLEAELEEPLIDTEREEIKIALQVLNHHNSKDRESYIQSIGENALATAVKLNDLTHNMDLSRIPTPTDKDFSRLERYKKEYTYLSQKLTSRKTTDLYSAH